MVSVLPAVLPIMLPAFNIEDWFFSVKLPNPCTVTPLSNCRVLPIAEVLAAAEVFAAVAPPATRAPPATLTVPLPVVAICCVPKLAKFKMLSPILSSAPSASVKSRIMFRVPMVLKLPLTVTSAKVPLFEFKALLSLLTSVPLRMVPLRELNPPLPNCPFPPISSVAPVLSSEPPKLT